MALQEAAEWVLRVLCDSLSASQICLGPAMGVGEGWVGADKSQNEGSSVSAERSAANTPSSHFLFGRETGCFRPGSDGVVAYLSPHTPFLIPHCQNASRRGIRSAK